MTQDQSNDDDWGGRALVVLVCLAVFGAMIFALARSRPGQGAAASKSHTVESLLAALTAEERVSSVGRVRSHCEGALAEPCACELAALREALDASFVDTAPTLLTDARAACAQPLKGQEAEIAARTGSKDAAAAAQAVLATAPNDPYASYALAHANWASGDPAATEHLAGIAVAMGRGAPAHLLIGLSALGRGDVEAARGAFVRALESEPNDVTALYDLALCDHRLNQYNAARSGYLAVLRLNPKHLDALFNLIILTSGAGFHDEAAHHLAEFRALVPGDPRIARLEAALAAAPVSSAATTVVTALPPSPSNVPLQRPSTPASVPSPLTPAPSAAPKP